MRTILKYFDRAVTLAIPVYLIAITLLLLLPDLSESGDAAWFKFDLLPSFFDWNAKAIIVAPLLLFSLGLGVKHARLWLISSPGAVPYIIAVLGAVTSVVIVALVYFTARIDAFWMNLPSFAGLVYARYIQHRGLLSEVKRKDFMTYMRQDAHTVFSAATLGASLLLVLATDIRFDIINQHSDYLEHEMAELTKRHIQTYQHQDPCFGNVVSYQSNLIFQILMLKQQYDLSCSDGALFLETLKSFQSLVSSGYPLGEAQVQALSTMVIRRLSKEPDDLQFAEEVYKIFDAAPEGGKICTTDGSYCLVRMADQQSAHKSPPLIEQ